MGLIESKIFAPKQRRHNYYLNTPAFCTTCEFVDKSVVEIENGYVCERYLPEGIMDARI